MDRWIESHGKYGSKNGWIDGSSHGKYGSKSGWIDGSSHGTDGSICQNCNTGGTSAFHESVHTTEEEFFEKEIREKVEEAPPGTVVVFDDARECVSSRQVRQFIDKQLRVGRHAGLSLLVILHSLRSGAWSSQAYSSIRYLTVFPRSQRAKITSFLNKELALPMGEARDHVYAFSQTGRTMMIRYHAPECLIGPKLLRLI